MYNVKDIKAISGCVMRKAYALVNILNTKKIYQRD